MSPFNQLEVTSSDALSVVLQHPAVAANQQIICRLTQVCQAWREAVEQSDARLADIQCTLWLPCNANDAARIANFAVKLARFAGWVARYAGTVRSLFLEIPSVPDDGPLIKSLITGAQNMLALGLRNAVQLDSVPQFNNPCHASSTLAAPSAGPVVSRPLQLQEFTCTSVLASPLLLSALPAAKLTQLTLKSPGPPDLVYDLQGLGDTTGGSSFNTTGVGPVAINLVHLTALQSLYVAVPEGLAALNLPEQLRTLELAYYEYADMALNFTFQHLQLQQLTIKDSVNTADDLLSLKQLQQLTRSELAYNHMDFAAAASPAWPQLAQQLVALEIQETIYCMNVLCSMSELSQILQALSSLTGLTRLEFSLDLYITEDGELEGVAQSRGICQTLKQLTNLENLRLDLQASLDLPENDILHLSTLTNLTELRLCLSDKSERALDSTNVIAVLQQLSKLQHLNLWSLADAEALPAIGRLQKLTYLSMSGLPQDLHQQSLKHLTGLKDLRVLDGLEHCSKVTMRCFWADLRS